jgi:UDP-N-acetylmuramoylalanine--D-glutamate ligase
MKSLSKNNPLKFQNISRFISNTMSETGFLVAKKTLQEFLLFKNNQYKNWLIYGYGVENKSLVQFIENNFPSIEITIIDDFDTNFRQEITEKEFEKNDIIIKSPGVDMGQIPGKFRGKTTNAVEIWLANLEEKNRQKVIGITGSKGKSSTAKFCAEMIENAGKKVLLCGNVGRPVFADFEDFLQGKFDFVIVELSSFQLENLRFSPAWAIFLNFFPEHLDRHKTMENYFQAKKNLWINQFENDCLIIPSKIEKEIKEENYWKMGQENFPGKIIFSKPVGVEKFPVESVFSAEHFLENWGTCWELGKALRLENMEKVFEETAKKFQGFPHRLEFFADKNNWKFYDDSISTNPYTVLAAIKFFKERLGILVLGGVWQEKFSSIQDKNLLPNKEIIIAWEEFFQQLKETSPDVLVLILQSPLEEIISKIAEKQGINFRITKNMAETVEFSWEKNGENKVFLLSPGGKSFDVFKNYQERGERFKALVKEG